MQGLLGEPWQMATTTESRTLKFYWKGKGKPGLTKERGVYNLYVQVAGGDGNVGQAIDVSPNEMEVDERPSCIRGLSADESVRPRELGVPSDGGEEVIAPRVPPVPAKPTQAEQDEHYATGHAAYRSWCEHCVKGRGRASPHAVVSEGELPKVGVDYALGQKDPK